MKSAAYITTYRGDGNPLGLPVAGVPLRRVVDHAGASERRPTRVRLVNARDMTQQDISAWTQILRSNPLFDSPFFRPEFVQLVARFRNDVEVAVLERDGKAIGFFSFHRLRGDVAMPVGMSLSDFHGVVIAPNATFAPQQLLRDCRLRAWRYDHVLAIRHEFAPHHWIAANSPYMDLSNGFEHYEQERRREGSDTIRKTLRKMRNLERDIGPLRLVPFTTDVQVLNELIARKLEQYRRVRSQNHLAEPWRIDLFRAIVNERGPQFGGMLSVLLAGYQPIAFHLGLLADGVLHAWFPTYVAEYSKYSPGLLFWVRMAQQASALGIRRIDLGKGPERFKQDLMTGVVSLREGAVDLRPVAGKVNYGWFRLRELIRSSPLRQPAQSIVRSYRSWTAYR